MTKNCVSQSTISATNTLDYITYCYVSRVNNYTKFVSVCIEINRTNCRVYHFKVQISATNKTSKTDIQDIYGDAALAFQIKKL